MRQRLDHIHGLRGVAAMAVIVQHSAQFVQDAGLPHFRLLLDNINLGCFGVVLFFLISGIVVPFSFRGETPVRNFLISRLFRIFPAFWLSIPVLSLASFIFVAPVSLDNFLANFSLFPVFWGGHDIGPGYWTLRFEMLFYLLCALMFGRRLLDDPALNGVYVLAALITTLAPVAAFFVYDDPKGGSNIAFFLAMFFLGMLLRRAFVEDCGIARKWALFLVPLAVIAGVLTTGAIYPVSLDGNPYLAPLPRGLGTTLPIVVLVLVLWLKPTPPKAVMYIGTISYSLYLFQDVALYSVRYVLPPADWPIGYVLGVIALTTLIASAVYRVVEQPMIDLGRKFTHRGAMKAVASPA